MLKQTPETERLHENLLETMRAAAPPGWGRLEGRAVVTLQSASTTTDAVMADGTRVRFGRGLGDVLRLRDAHAGAGRGAWFVLDVVLHRDGRWGLSADDTASVEEADLFPLDCAEQVRRFPRDPENVLPWLAEKLRGAMDATVPDHRALDAVVQRLVAQEDYSPDGAALLVEDDDVELDAEQVRQREDLGARIVAELARRGVDAVAETPGDDEGPATVSEPLEVCPVDSLVPWSVLVAPTWAALMVDQDFEPDEDEEFSYREAFTLVLTVHDALQTVSGWRAVRRDAIAEQVLAVAHLDDDSASLRTFICRALGLTPPGDSPEAQDRLRSSCPACGWHEAGADHGQRSAEACPACAFQPADGVADGPSPTPLTWRAWWVLGAMSWRSTATVAPAGWDPTARLAHHLAAQQHSSPGTP